MFCADFNLEDLLGDLDGPTTTKAPPKVVPKVPAATKAPVKPKPKPGENAASSVFIASHPPETSTENQLFAFISYSLSALYFRNQFSFAVNPNPTTSCSLYPPPLYDYCSHILIKLFQSVKL